MTVYVTFILLAKVHRQNIYMDKMTKIHQFCKANFHVSCNHTNSHWGNFPVMASVLLLLHYTATTLSQFQLLNYILTVSLQKWIHLVSFSRDGLAWSDGGGGGCSVSSGAELCRSCVLPAHQLASLLQSLAWLLYLNCNCCSQFAYHHVITQITVSYFVSNNFCLSWKIAPPLYPLCTPPPPPPVNPSLSFRLTHCLRSPIEE